MLNHLGLLYTTWIYLLLKKKTQNEISKYIQEKTKYSSKIYSWD